ncbi:hypothetical protein [Pseudomonas aeruginosa]|nr:hypothetical protein [Pseudomonas aeruginosa]
MARIRKIEIANFRGIQLLASAEMFIRSAGAQLLEIAASRA